MKRRLAILAIVPTVLVTLAAPALAARPGFVFPGICCYYEGQVVRTVRCLRRFRTHYAAEGQGFCSFWKIKEQSTSFPSI